MSGRESVGAVAIAVHGGGIRLPVRVQPRASRDEIAGAHGEALRVRLTSPPVEGAANDALVALLAETFGVPRRAVTIVSGATSRTKVVEVDGISEAEARRRLAPAHDG